MLKDGMSLCNSCGRSTSGVECTNPGCQDALASARLASVTAERDALAAQLAAQKDSDSTLSISPMIAVTSSTGQPELFEYSRMRLELAALRRRLANAERGIVEHYQDHHGDHVLCVACDYPAGTKVALVRLEDGVSETKNCGDGSPVPFEER